MQVFNIRIRGTNKFMPIMANTKAEATEKFIQLINSKKVFTIQKPNVGQSIQRTRNIFRGGK